MERVGRVDEGASKGIDNLRLRMARSRSRPPERPRGGNVQIISVTGPGGEDEAKRGRSVTPSRLTTRTLILRNPIQVEEEVVRKLAPFKPVPPARPPHLARTLPPDLNRPVPSLPSISSLSIKPANSAAPSNSKSIHSSSSISTSSSPGAPVPSTPSSTLLSSTSNCVQPLQPSKGATSTSGISLVKTSQAANSGLLTTDSIDSP